MLFHNNLNYILLNRMTKIGLTKSKSSASSVVVSSIFVMHLMNGAHFLIAACVTGDAATVILPFTKM